MTGAPAPVTILAPAKVNLSLAVVGRRTDGYHDIDAPTVPVDLCDTVTVSPRGGPGNTSDSGVAGLDPANDLALRAADLMASACSPAAGVAVRVTKRVPVGAGLGGGSSVAAAVLLACDRMWGLGWPAARLAEAGATLGADVPFFVACRQARMRGIGERLCDYGPVGGWCVIRVPRQRVMTAQTYDLYDRMAGAAKGGNAPRGVGGNDLTAAAVRLCPAIGDALAALRAEYGNSRMTGSGNACFALCADRPREDGVARMRGSGDEVFVARILAGRPAA